MIYIVRCTATGLRKIGSAEDPVRRLQDLQTGSAAPLLLEAEADMHDWTERALHRELLPRRVHHEWFDVTFEEIQTASRAESVARFGAFEWSRFAYSSWDRISTLGFEPRVDTIVDNQGRLARLHGVDSNRPDPSQEEIDLCLSYIRTCCVRAFAWNERHTDDHVRHLIRRQGNPSRGALIVAALQEGYPVRRARFGYGAEFCWKVDHGRWRR